MVNGGASEHVFVSLSHTHLPPLATSHFRHLVCFSHFFRIFLFIDFVNLPESTSSASDRGANAIIAAASKKKRNIVFLKCMVKFELWVAAFAIRAYFIVFVFLFLCKKNLRFNLLYTGKLSLCAEQN